MPDRNDWIPSRLECCRAARTISRGQVLGDVNLEMDCDIYILDHGPEVLPLRCLEHGRGQDRGD